MNETEFCVGYDKTRWLITINLNKPLPLINSDNQKYILLVKNISNKEKIISWILILYTTFILKKWTKKNNFAKDILLATSPNKYCNNELGLQWFEYFKIHN